jgi:hypothetical protein
LRKIIAVIVFTLVFYNGFTQDSRFEIVAIKVYANNNEIEGPFYRNINEPSLYIKLVNIFESFCADVKVYNTAIEIKGNDPIGNIIIIYNDETDIFIKQIKEYFIYEFRSPGIVANKIMLFNNEYYITLDLFSILTRCLSIMDEDKNVYITGNH